MMFMTLLVITVLCLVIPFTRMYGVIGSVALLYFYPYITLALVGVLILGAAAFYYFKRRKSNAEVHY